jgi:hypothetical protein
MSSPRSRIQFYISAQKYTPETHRAGDSDAGLSAFVAEQANIETILYLCQVAKLVKAFLVHGSFRKLALVPVTSASSG